MTAASRPSPASPVEQILAAAAAVFAEEGFGGARVEAIAARAQVNKAMLYYHVGDKRELYAAVLARNLEHARQRVAAAVHSPGTVRQRLQGVIRSLVEVVEELPHHPRIMLRELASGGQHLPPEVARQMLEVLALLKGLLAEGVEKGELKATDALLTHLLILGAVTFMTATRPLRARFRDLAPDFAAVESPQQLAEFLAAVLLDGIAVGGGAR